LSIHIQLSPYTTNWQHHEMPNLATPQNAEFKKKQQNLEFFAA